MSTFVLAIGTVDPESEISRREVGEDKKKLTSFRIATDPGWYTVDCWGALADQVPPPGTFIVVTGRLNTRSFENKDGVKVTVTSIVASAIQEAGVASAPKAAADIDPLFGD